MSKVEALDDPRHDTPDLLPPPGTMDHSSIATAAGNGPFGRSRNGSRSWIISGLCLSRTEVSCPQSRSTSALTRSGRSK